jgi:hypothetical protein
LSVVFSASRTTASTSASLMAYGRGRLQHDMTARSEATTDQPRFTTSVGRTPS